MKILKWICRQLTGATLYWKIIAFMLSVIFVMNFAACNKSFCDVYSDIVYGKIADKLGKITGLIPIAFGEILMYLGILLLLLAMIFVIMHFAFIRKKQYQNFVKQYMRGLFFLFIMVLFIYTFHWVIPFRSNLLGKSKHKEVQYSEERLRLLRTYIVENLNAVSKQVKRDSEGHIQYDDIDAMYRTVADAMNNISDEYPRLKGYYPPMKAALCSDVLEYMWIGGFTYPYTMEVTYNKYITNLYYPSLLAHESAHHKGYYKENEANFLSYLACTNSEDPIVRYSAFLDMFKNYLTISAIYTILTPLRQ